jgi:hypothetical protein
MHVHNKDTITATLFPDIRRKCQHISCDVTITTRSAIRTKIYFAFLRTLSGPFAVLYSRGALSCPRSL